MKRILIPLDGSEGDAWTLKRVGRLLEGASVTLMGVVDAPPHLAADLGFRVDPRHAEFNAALAAARDRLGEASAEIRFGDPAEAILREIREGSHDLVVLSSPFRKVLRGSTIPLLLVRPYPGPGAFRRILAVLEGSAHEEDILPPAIELARRAGAEIRLFRTETDERLERWKEGLRAGGLKTSVAVGPSALEAARAWGAELLALSARLAERAVKKTSLPLLAAPDAEARDVVPAPEGGPVLRVT